MRALILFLLLMLPAFGAVVPDGTTVPRDDGAPVLPLTASENNPSSATSVSSVVRRPTAANPAAGQNNSAPNSGAAGVNEAAGSEPARGSTAPPGDPDVLSASEPLEPVIPAAQQPVPWYLVALALCLLVATVVIGLMIRQDRGEPS